MSRPATVLDRTAAVIVGLVLVLVGVGVFLWNSAWFNGIPEFITAPGLALSVRSWWWPWAVTAAGIALVLLGMRWLTSHSMAPRAHTAALPGSGVHGSLTTDLSAIASAASRRLELNPSVRSAKATAIVDRGRRTIDITAITESVHDIAAATAAADQVCCEAITMIGDDSIATRTRIRVKTTNPRVRRLN